MHRLIKEHLEEHLRHGPAERFPQELGTHLETCDECRDEVNAFREHSSLLASLRAQEAAPAPGFYARVMERIEAQQQVSIWSVFLDPTFGRRLVLGSMTTLVLLGGFLVLAEANRTAPATTAESIMAVEDHPPGLGQDPQRDRETILVTLATYRE